MVENRTVDLVIDSNTSFAYIMEFMDVTTDFMNSIDSRVPVDLTGATFKGDIKKELDASAPVLSSFDFSIVTPKSGIATMSLTSAKVKAVADQASKERDKYNNRIRFAGYYDVLITYPNKQPMRILEGKIYVSDGVTITNGK